jgi:hypothetical protein
VLGGSAYDLEAFELDRLAPVQLDDVGDTTLLQPRLDTEGDHEERIEVRASRRTVGSSR